MVDGRRKQRSGKIQRVRVVVVGYQERRLVIGEANRAYRKEKQRVVNGSALLEPIAVVTVLITR